MKVTILGCGTSTGVPVPSCECAVCLSKDPKNSRLRASICIRTATGRNIVIDTSPDFRQQVLKANIKKIDAILYTHAHADHILGLDDLRSFNFSHGSIACYATNTAWQGIQKTFDYVFNPSPNYKGGGLPKIERHFFATYDQLEICGEKINTFELMHGDMEVIGFRLGNFAYATDCNFIPDRSMKILQGVKTLVIDGLRYQPHATHFTIDEALKIADELQVERAIFTHYTHSVDYNEVSAKLPPGRELAFDGMEIEI